MRIPSPAGISEDVLAPEGDPEATLKLKIEIDTREHESLYGIKQYPFQIDCRWRQARNGIPSFEPEEPFGTKPLALLLRRKNRDLFDLHEGLKQLSMDPDKLITRFEYYLSLEGKPVSRAVAEQRMLEKPSRSLTKDIKPFLPVDIQSNDDALDAFGNGWKEPVTRIKGDPWKLSEQVIAEGRYLLLFQKALFFAELPPENGSRTRLPP